MFCVMCIIRAPAKARCAEFGSAAPIVALRSEYHSITKAGSRSNACGVATVAGSILVQIPSGSRKVSMPDSADRPAPEKDTTISASSMSALAVAMAVSTDWRVLRIGVCPVADGSSGTLRIVELQGAPQRHTLVRKLALIIIAGLLLAAIAAPAGAQSAPDVDAEIGLDGYVDPNQPIPIRVELSSPVLWVGTLRASLGSQQASTEIEVPAGGVKVYDLQLAAPGSNVNRQIRLAFTPDGQETPSDTVNVQIRFATSVELVAAINGDQFVDVLSQARTTGVGLDVDVAEISAVTPSLGVASYLVTGRGGLDGLSADEVTDLEGWLTDGGRLIGAADDVQRVGTPDGPSVTFGGADIAPYGRGEIITVDPTSLSVDAWSDVLRPTPTLFISQNFGNPVGFDLFQAATGDSTAGTPQIPWLFGGLVAYALLVGPINFVVLRSMGKREWVWITIPALSAVAVFAFWLFGPRTAVAQVTHASAVILDGETGTAQTGLVMVAGQEGEHTLGVPDGWSASQAGNLGQFFGPVPLGGQDLVASTDTELTFDTDSLEAVPVRATHPVSLPGLDVSATIDGRRVQFDIDNQSDVSFWFWGVGVGLSAVGGEDELGAGEQASRSAQPGINQDPWQAPMATAYWNRTGNFFEDGNEVWQIIEPLGREVGRSDGTLFAGEPYFFGFTDDLNYEVTVDGRDIRSQGPVLVVVPIEFGDTDLYDLGRLSGDLLASSGQEFIEQGFSPFIVGADEVFIRFEPPSGVTSASINVNNPFGGGFGNQTDVSVYDWDAGVFVDVVDIVGNRVERIPLAGFQHPSGEVLVRLEPQDFGEIYPSSVTMEWTP